MKEEMKRILKMLEEKKLSAEEAEKLIELVEPEEGADLLSEGNVLKADPQFLRIRVVDGNETKVNINVPLSLVEVGLKIGMKVGPQFAPQVQGIDALKEIDFKELIEAIRHGARGKIVDVQAEDTVVEIFVD